jgi:hypothetical protein
VLHLAVWHSSPIDSINHVFNHGPCARHTLPSMQLVPRFLVRLWWFPLPTAVTLGIMTPGKRPFARGQYTLIQETDLSPVQEMAHVPISSTNEYICACKFTSRPGHPRVTLDQDSLGLRSNQHCKRRHRLPCLALSYELR